MMIKRPGKMDTYRRVASVVAASSQKDVEDAEMQPTDESVPLRYVRASMRHAAPLVIAAYCVVTQPVAVPSLLFLWLVGA